MTLTTVVVSVAFLAVAVSVWLYRELRTARTKLEDAVTERSRLENQYAPILDAEKERNRILSAAETQRQQIVTDAQAERERLISEATGRRAALDREFQEMTARRDAVAGELVDITGKIVPLRQQLAALDEEATLETFGFYKPRYSFADSATYAAKLDSIRDDQKTMLKAKTAAVCPVQWTVGGSRAEGKKATNQTLKLMLRAFNGECDAAIAKVKYNNVKVMEARIHKAFEVINSLAEVNQCRIVPEYRDLKLQELSLVHEYEEKLQDEKEEQRRIREQIRDEEIAQRQFEKARADAEREEERFANALAKAKEDVEAAEGAKQAKLRAQIEELERRLAEAHETKERAISQAQLTRSGHVYIISNIGSFGEHVYKIGMTRRLDPIERIKELGDASVPFSFDIHAVIYSEDAPSLEAELHGEFTARRVNRVNERKEFFRVTIDEIVTAVRKRRGEIEVTRLAAAEEYRKTQALYHAEGQWAMIPIGNDPSIPAYPTAAAQG